MAKSSSKKDSKKDSKTLKNAAGKLKKAVGKVVAKVTAKAVKPAKSAVKPPAKAAKPTAKKVEKKPVPKAGAKAAAKKESPKETPKKAAAKPVATIKETEKVQALKVKKEAVAPKGKKAKKAKATEEEMEDDLVGESEDFGSDELDEYTEELEIAIEDNEVDEAEWTDASGNTGLAVLPPQEDFITDAEGNRICRVRDCDQIARVDAHCRYHYLLLWKKIQVRKKILIDGKLERYVEELTARYPDKFLEVIRRDLRSEKEFMAAIQELEIDESNLDNDFEDESQSFIDEVRGAATESMSDDEEF